MRSLLHLSALCAATVLSACGSSPSDFDGPHGIKALYAGNSFVYVVPVPGGVVLVDSGGDTSGAKIKDTLGDKEILAVLLTHAHTDHIGGLQVVGNAPVLVGRKEVPLLKGDEKYKGAATATLGRFSKTPDPPSNIVPVDQGHVLSFGTLTFTAVAASGHTPGSMAWKFADVLFTGDAALGGKEAARSPWFFDDDIHQSDETVKALWTQDFKTMLDGHTGQTEKADATVRGG